MANESIFNFLKSDVKFHGVYTKCIELEKVINIDLYDALRNTSRQICERLLQIIIIDDKKDEYLEYLCYVDEKDKKNLNLYETIDECFDLDYIDENIKDMYHELRIYGNDGSHYNEDELTPDEIKKYHKYTFYVVLDCFSRFHDVSDIEYEFKINPNLLTQVELDDILSNIPNEISKNAVINNINIKNILLPTNLLNMIVSRYLDKITDLVDFNNFLNNNEYVTSDNLNKILDMVDDSFKANLKQMIMNSNKTFMNKFKRMPKVINIIKIRDLVKNTKDTFEKEFYKLIDIISTELLRNYLLSINEKISGLKIIDDENNIVDAPTYEIVETDDSIEIKKIEEIIGIPDKCPKCKSLINPGAVKCHNCGYNLFDIINKRCPKCGKRIPIGEEFCSRCGNNLEKHICKKCGFENDKNHNFCVNCGEDLNV